LCLVLGAAGRPPSDQTMGATALVEVLLNAQIVVAVAAPATGNTPTGDPLEFWIYLVSAALLPVAAGFWGLLDRSRWSTVVLGVAAVAVAIMLYRMQQIWSVQVYVPA
ncbi:hypothetical protein, partial [Mycetocola reblochoni]|uniref:hypothetical protein n=1 Tax=Mycetocola reblochoni TaxID=331618 RepID=UPI003F99328A